MKTKLAFLAVAAVALSGCAIQQTVKPVEQFAGKEICVVENPAVKHDFLPVFSRALTQRGYEVRTLAPDASLVACPITATYTANWRWDLATYMAYADITVYNNGKPAGKATYDATGGANNPGKFISAEKKITELVQRLFPG
jgi:uncharacterized lipoprotein YajG